MRKRSREVMWVVLKFDKKNLSTLKFDLINRVGCEIKYYQPKFLLKKFLKNKIKVKEEYLLGDYLFCFHKNFSNKAILDSIKYCKGLKYFLTNYVQSQESIINFIHLCKTNEDDQWYIKSSFFKFKSFKKFKIISGPLTNFVFDLIEENKFSLKANINNYRFTVSKKNNLLSPVN